REPSLEAPGARSASPRDAELDRIAPSGGVDDARCAERPRLPRDRDAIPDPLDAGGRPRLSRPRSCPTGVLLRAAAVPAAVQAAADDRGARALLPDRPLLPR